MKRNGFLNKVKWSLVSVAAWTMSFSPAAMGQPTQNYTVEQLRENLNTLGLNKRMTLGQFYEKNKNLMPERIRKEVELAISDSRNVLMPSFEVVSAKTTTGETIPTIRISTDRELVNIQWFGEKNKVVKYQTAHISEIDIANFNDMFARILATDANLRAQYEPKPISRMTSGFKYPDVTKAEWKSMSMQAKAAYIVNLRTVWQQAREVLAIKEKLKGKKTSQFQFKNNYFFELLSGSDAFAAGTRRASASRAAPRTPAQSCIVAGYTSQYENGVCSVAKARTQYANNELVTMANTRCESSAPGSIACNPFIYGAPSGNPICITPSRTDEGFQKATHFDGPCDSQSRLQSEANEVAFLRDSTTSKREGRYSPENMSLSMSDLEAHFRNDPQSRQLTENYIMGVLKLRGATDRNSLSEVVFNDESLAQVKEIRDKFKTEIEEARQTCEQVTNGTGSVEKNYIQACDQLHRRFIFIDVALSNRCQAGGLTYNADTLKCSCPIAGAPTPPPAAAPPASTPPAPATPPVASEVVPGGSCRSVASVAAAPPAGTVPPAVSPTASVSTSLPTTCDDVVSNPDCTCANGSRPRGGITDRVTGAVAGMTCAASVTTGGDSNRNCDFLCKIGRGVGSVFKAVVKYAPVLLAAGVSIYLITKLAPKKPALAAPADKCPNGSLAPCPQPCTGNKVPLPNGSCGCPACGFGLVSDSSCQCVVRLTSSDPTGVKKCGDGTYVNSASPCPTYACWNGSSYENPTQCPSQLPAAESTGVRSGTQ